MVVVLLIYGGIVRGRRDRCRRLVVCDGAGVMVRLRVVRRRLRGSRSLVRLLHRVRVGVTLIRAVVGVVMRIIALGVRGARLRRNG